MTLELDNVELYFSKKPILTGVYLKAESGKITGILGHNGSGKSCLLEIIFGYLKPKYKLLRLDGRPILKPFYLSKIVKYLPQSHFVPNRVKLQTLFDIYKVDWNEFCSIFEGFYKYQKATFGSLSGGERRLIETYLVLKSASEVILLDEPFSHLAPLYIENLKKVIVEEKSQKTILITDHLYKHILDVTDTLYLLKNDCTKLVTDVSELEHYKYVSEGTLDI